MRRPCDPAHCCEVRQSPRSRLYGVVGVVCVCGVAGMPPVTAWLHSSVTSAWHQRTRGLKRPTRGRGRDTRVCVESLGWQNGGGGNGRERERERVRARGRQSHDHGLQCYPPKCHQDCAVVHADCTRLSLYSIDQCWICGETIVIWDKHGICVIAQQSAFIRTHGGTCVVLRGPRRSSCILAPAKASRCKGKLFQFQDILPDTATQSKSNNAPAKGGGWFSTSRIDATGFTADPAEEACLALDLKKK